MVKLSGIVLLAAVALAGCRRDASPIGMGVAHAAPVEKALQPWEPVDPQFKGCEGG
jgi:hypothetical protein